MAGFAVAEWAGTPDGLMAYIRTIEVLPEARGQGIAGELLGRAAGSARDAGADLIWLHVDAENAAAIRLYEAAGFQCEGREENYYPKGRAALIYIKTLK